MTGSRITSSLTAPLALFVWCVAPLPSRAEVEMGATANCTVAADLGLAYVNRTPDAWDMRGYAMRFGSATVAGNFAAGSGGTFFVPPGATAQVNFGNCGSNTGRPSHKQLFAKTGTCNEPEPPPMPPTLACAELDGKTAYNPNVCLTDSLGVGKGAGYGGFLDGYADRTQIQVAATPLFDFNGHRVRFDPASMGGPFYLMSMVALQEYLQVDMQALLALGAAATSAGLADSAGAPLYLSPPNTFTDMALYGSFGISYQTATGRLFTDYPKYFPGPPNLGKMVATAGTGPTLANSPQQLNSGFLAAMNLWWHFDGLKAAQDLCFANFLREAADKRAGLKLILDGTLAGPNVVDQNTGADDYATHLLPTTSAAVLGAADITPYLKSYPWDIGGPDHATHNPLNRIVGLLDPIVAATSRTVPCGGSLAIYDPAITLPQLQQLFFGTGGTAAAQGNGGLLLHFAIPAAARQNLWSELACAFAKLQGKAPGTTGTQAISFRYDYLNILRAARGYLAGYLDKFSDPPQPADAYSSDYSIWIFNHSRKTCTRSVQDKTFPLLTLADGNLGAGDKVESGATDNVGISRRQFTTDVDWRAWKTAQADFKVPALAAADRLWYRVVDSCGNAVIEEAVLSHDPVAAEKPAHSRRFRVWTAPGRISLEGAALSVVCYDAMGVYLGAARPTGRAEEWALPGNGPMVLEIRWAAGGRARIAIR